MIIENITESDFPGMVFEYDRGGSLFGATNNFALYSKCKRYRYRLVREWIGNDDRVLFIMLNPSTATAFKNDPTVARCQKFAARWGCCGFEVRNIFAYRSTDPKGLKEVDDPIGDNPIWYEGDKFFLVVAAWGNHGEYMGRGDQVLSMLYDKRIVISHFGLTNKEQPRHPLYVRGDTVLKRFA